MDNINYYVIVFATFLVTVGYVHSYVMTRMVMKGREDLDHLNRRITQALERIGMQRRALTPADEFRQTGVGR